MSKKLNKNRIRDTKIIIAVMFLVILFSRQMIGHNELVVHELLEFTGYFLVSFCAMGRLYCTAFLGGQKNQNVIDYGPFSVCRNPLYAFSLIGILGITLISNHLIVMAVVPFAMLIVYHYLIKREEVYLEEKFGKEYVKYKNSVPRLFPKFSLYKAPQKVDMYPKTLLRAFGDAAMWFLAFPLIESIEYVQEAGYLKPLFMLP